MRKFGDILPICAYGKFITCFLERAQLWNLRLRCGWTITFKLSLKGGWPWRRDRNLNFWTPLCFWNGWSYGVRTWNLVGLRGWSTWGTSLRTTNNPQGGVTRLQIAVLEFWDSISRMGEARDLKFGVWMEYVTVYVTYRYWLVNDKLSSPGSRDQFFNFNWDPLSLSLERLKVGT